MRNVALKTHHRIGPQVSRTDHIPDKIVGFDNAGSAQNDRASAMSGPDDRDQRNWSPVTGREVSPR